MPLVVADTGPLYYLVPTGDIELLPKLFERVLVPQVVRDELANAEAPQAVRDWIARAPGWLDARPAHPGADDVAMAKLDEGERAAIALALAVKAELVLMDDREGVGIARGRGVRRYSWEAVVRWRALAARGVPKETSPATSSWRTAATEPSDCLRRPEPRRWPRRKPAFEPR